MKSKLPPGLQKRPRRDGSTAYYWIAERVDRRVPEDYPVRTVRLHYDTDEARAQACNTLTAELQVWLRLNGRLGGAQYTGTIASLAACYQQDEDSPYHAVKATTRANYDYDLGLLVKAVGHTRVDRANGKDFTRWHRGFKAPAEPGGQERIRRAHGAMTMLRIIVNYGATMRHAGCGDAAAILSKMRFESPKARETALTLEQAEAVIAAALAGGRVSIALGQALQFELALRQTDVIGEWIPAAPNAGGLVHHARQWTGGLTWADLRKPTLEKETLKKGTRLTWDLSRYPLLRVLDVVPEERRVGPVIVDESTGRPYLEKRYSKVWRQIATTAGIPRSVWNRDSRAGAITEGFAAGAEAKDLQKAATHKNYQTTTRYIRDDLAATNRVADLRSARRNSQRT